MYENHIKFDEDIFILFADYDSNYFLYLVQSNNYGVPV